jgi:hypothetical protein
LGSIGSGVPAFVSPFSEAMRVLHVPTPPSFHLDPATGIAIAPTEAAAATNTDNAGKSSAGGTAVDVAV